MSNELELASYKGTPPMVPIAIQRPEGFERVEALTKKLGVYEDRLEQYRYKAPDSPGHYAEWCKHAVLGKVLEEGGVNSKDIVEGFADRPGFDLYDTEEALRIVSDYCLTGGENLQGSNLPTAVPYIEPSWARADNKG